MARRDLILHCPNWPRLSEMVMKWMGGLYLAGLLIYLFFRAITPFWLDMAVGISAVAVALIQVMRSRL